MSLLNIDQLNDFGDELVPYKDLLDKNKARVVCVSDTHNHHRSLNIPQGDIFIHAGDITQRGTLRELKDFNEWLGSIPHQHKIVIGGNHDEILEDPSLDKNEVFTNCTYLEHSSIEVYGWTIYGFPCSLKLFSNHTKPAYVPGFVINLLDYLKPYKAFQLDVGTEKHGNALSRIPGDTDILISHGPPFATRDLTTRGSMHGDKDLRYQVENRIMPHFHVFGHIHEAYGVATNGTTTFINAASPKYPWAKGEFNKPIVFDINIKHPMPSL